MDHGEDLLQSRLVRRLGKPGLRAEVRGLRGEGREGVGGVHNRWPGLKVFQ